MAGLTRPRFRLLVGSAALLLAVLALRALESQWPPLALWAFVLLSLTLGFGHGALDAVLLLAQFAPRSTAMGVSALYLLIVLLAGWALSWSVPWALLLLVLMSVWHFGELHSYALWARLCVGGASVMWPMLVAHHALSGLVQGSLGAGFGQAWRIWHIFAIGWFALLCACALGGAVRWLWGRKKMASGSRANGQNQHQHQHQHQNQNQTNGTQAQMMLAAIEILAILCAYLLLSPLLAFALYFGVYHCLAHIARVRSAVLAHSTVVLAPYAKAFAISLLGTALLLALLWWFLPSVSWLSKPAALDHSGQVLQWLIVSLAAVTLPHLMLVSYSARWLQR
jgi:beta-carotene 15,15'-dioxygenase